MAMIDPAWSPKHTKHILEMFKQLRDGTLYTKASGPSGVFDMIDRRVVTLPPK